MIAWQRDNGANNQADIWGGVVHWDGTVTAQPFLISGCLNLRRRPRCRVHWAGSNRYLVTYTDTYPGDRDIIMALLDGSTLLDLQDLSVMENFNYCSIRSSRPWTPTAITFSCVLGALRGR